MWLVSKTAFLRQFVPTRWWTQVSMLASVLSNREQIETVLLKLRNDRYSDIFHGMGLSWGISLRPLKATL